MPTRHGAARLRREAAGPERRPGLRGGRARHGRRPWDVAALQVGPRPALRGIHGEMGGRGGPRGRGADEGGVCVGRTAPKWGGEGRDRDEPMGRVGWRGPILDGAGRVEVLVVEVRHEAVVLNG
jgi:hypothetical protein